MRTAVVWITVATGCARSVSPASDARTARDVGGATGATAALGDWDGIVELEVLSDPRGDGKHPASVERTPTRSCARRRLPPR